MIPVPKTPQPMSPLAIAQPQPVFQDASSVDDIYNFDEANEDLENEEEVAKNQSVANRRSNLPGLTKSGDSNPLLYQNGTVSNADSVSDPVDKNLAFQSELRATINNFKSEYLNLSGSKDQVHFLPSLADGGLISSQKSTRPLSVAMDSFNHQPPVPYLDFQSNKSLTIGLPRTNSVEFKRTVSSDLANPAMTHRRTQSYDTRQVRIMTSPSIVRSPSKLSQQSSFRSVLNSRESYAAPMYTGGALVERNMSMYRKGIIENVIQ